MKIRQGFVSNSNSTSFTIFGISSKESEFDERVEELAQEKGLILKELGVCFFYGDPNNYPSSVYLGQEYCNMKDNETKNEFEKRIQMNIDIDINSLRTCPICFKIFYETNMISDYNYKEEQERYICSNCYHNKYEDILIRDLSVHMSILSCKDRKHENYKL